MDSPSHSDSSDTPGEPADEGSGGEPATGEPPERSDGTGSQVPPGPAGTASDESQSRASEEPDDDHAGTWLALHASGVPPVGAARLREPWLRWIDVAHGEWHRFDDDVIPTEQRIGRLYGLSGPTTDSRGPVSLWWVVAVLGLAAYPILAGIAIVTLGEPVAQTVGQGGGLSGPLPQERVTVAIAAIAGAVIARLVVPIAMFKDGHAVKQSGRSGWRPYVALYATGTFVVPPPVEFVVCAVYLVRRFRNVN